MLRSLGSSISLWDKRQERRVTWILVLCSGLCCFSCLSFLRSKKNKYIYIYIKSGIYLVNQWNWLEQIYWKVLLLICSPCLAQKRPWKCSPLAGISGNFCLAISHASVRHTANNVSAHLWWSQNISWSHLFWSVLRWFAESRSKSSLGCFLVGWWEADWNK